MTPTTGPTRRSVLGGAVAAAAVGAVSAPARAAAATPAPAAGGPSEPLWRTALDRGLLFGSSAATWQLADLDYAALFARQAAVLLTEDDLLWYRLRSTPTSGLDFGHADRIVDIARRNRQLVLGAHLAWDEGFGPGWSHRDLWGLDRAAARRLLYGTIDAVVSRYRGRVSIWSCVNEAIVNGSDSGLGGRHGLREDVPWFATIGPDYVEQSFFVAHAANPGAMLLLNDFGYETVDRYGDRPEDKRRATLHVLDRLLAAGAPVSAFGVQAHLLAEDFVSRFDAIAYRRFLRELADRGLTVLITELDVLDDGLPARIPPRDRLVADVYRRYLDVALDEPAVAGVLTFGLSDRYTWLQEDDPRSDGAARRPLPYDERLGRTPAFSALKDALERAPVRRPLHLGPRRRPGPER